ncbi:hypothetical protein GCM10027275_16700 [Rhabdobacter roseus]|uniref:Lin1244/Lin1753-like N-terminal domain-containing protein n=1 Tax=Rhabdobacter roseus TaxID=1655419 RepID=A0A840TPV7_9BACT|nr:DUF4373 domain-containing protein [Rhabdobacter roseus]MBB5283592.1 hypothetical protein [Rhabdobacter roseus]
MKEAYYFSHDSNARHDPKITAMRSVYGSEGYGWYWMLIEMMRESENYKLDLQAKYARNAYAVQLQCDCNAFASFLHDCIEEFGLFASDGTSFWSESLLRRMREREEKSQKARESANARWQKDRKNANASNNHANAAKSDALKEIKGKERKENINNTSFDDFWAAYGKKNDRKKCEEVWAKIPDKDKPLILAAIPSYVQNTPDPQYRKNPLTYLRGKCWLDEGPTPVSLPPTTSAPRITVL